MEVGRTALESCVGGNAGSGVSVGFGGNRVRSGVGSGVGGASVGFCGVGAGVGSTVGEGLSVWDAVAATVGEGTSAGMAGVPSGSWAGCATGPQARAAKANSVRMAMALMILRQPVILMPLCLFAFGSIGPGGRTS